MNNKSPFALAPTTNPLTRYYISNEAKESRKDRAILGPLAGSSDEVANEVCTSVFRALVNVYPKGLTLGQIVKDTHLEKYDVGFGLEALMESEEVVHS